MKSSNQRINGLAQPNKPNPVATVSERKLKANRENAKKSTGPKTPRGKAFSGRNALKHGLLAMDVLSKAPFQRENPQEFKRLVDDLREAYRPCGAAEELEVERIAKCRWRLDRAWRYENAEIRRGQVEAEARGHEPLPMPDEFQTALRLLQDAEKEIEAGRHVPREESDSKEPVLEGLDPQQPVSEELISEELKQKIFAAFPSHRERWPWMEQKAREFEELECERQWAILAPKLGLSKLRSKRLRDIMTNAHFDHRREVALTTIRLAIRLIELEYKQVVDSLVNHLHELEAIPNRDVIEKLLRYETGFERSLDRAVDRLERLQRIRRGEPVPTR
jgi:hypothetical protein